MYKWTKVQKEQQSLKHVEAMFCNISYDNDSAKKYTVILMN